MKPGFDKPSAQSNPMVELILSDCRSETEAESEGSQSKSERVVRHESMVELILSEAKDLIK